MIKTILGSVREYKRPAILTPIFVSMEVILECIIPYVMAMLIDTINAGGDMWSAILKYGSILILLAFASLFSGIMSGTCAARASTGFAKNLRHDLYYKVQDFAFEDIDDFTSSSLVTRLTTDVTNVQHAFQMITRIAVRTPLMLISSIVMSFSINANMSWIFVAILPILGVGLGLIATKVFPIFKRIFKKYDKMNDSIQENVSGIRVVKSFVREDYEQDKFKKVSSEVCDDFTMAEKILALNNPIMMSCIYVAMLLVCYLGARLIITSGGSSFTTGELSSLITYGVQILSAMMMLSMVFVMISMSVESASRIAEVLEKTPSLDTNADKEGAIREVKDGSIVFDNVSFKYASRSEQYALQDVSLSIGSGETVGILGGTGSSKSTLVQLISRLYDVDQGSVKVGGVDVRDYNLEDLRNQVAVVLQKNVLFAGTIKENLKWGDKNATDEEIIKACKIAQADDFVRSFPEGYDTHIEQGGTNVSGGQKQRLCIARAILKHPKIIIFDDSTSAVDTKTDAMIRSGLRESLPTTTKLIIAQRVSSVSDADKIIVMDNGKIAEMGTHSELLALGGIYREVYDSQNSTKKEVR